MILNFEKIIKINFLAVFLLLLPLVLFAEEHKNIGFKKDVSQGLKQKFPMCEEFLNVKWIDEERYIGKLKAEFTYRGKNQGVVYALVKAEKTGSYKMRQKERNIFYGGRGMGEQEYNSREFEKFIQEAKYTFALGEYQMNAKSGKTKKEFYQNIIPFHPMGNERVSKSSFAGFTKNICLLYPEEDAVFIVEDKKPFQDENLSKDLRQKYEYILKVVTKRCGKIEKAVIEYKCDTASLKYATSIDMNLDGIEDYKSQFNNLGSGGRGKELIFFSRNKKLEFLYLPERCRTHTRIGHIFYAIKDKRALHYDNCNLTTFIKGEN